VYANALNAEGKFKMPYAVKGKTVIRRDTGRVVGHSKNPKKYLRTLNAIEHGFRPSKVKRVSSKFYGG